MNLSDQEMELLDRYLDRDLTDAEAIGLEARLKADADVSAELVKMREFRSLRAEAFASLEPSEVESQQLQWYVRDALHQQQSVAVPIGAFDRVGRWAGGLSRMAAVLALGLVVGYGIRGNSVGSGPALVTSNKHQPGAIDLTQPGQPLVLGTAGAGGGTGVVQVSNLGQPAYEVSLTDQSGKVVATQRFGTLQEAREFAKDLGKWQQKHRQVQTNGVRLVGDDF